MDEGVTMPMEPGEERRTDLAAAIVDLRLSVERMSGDMKVAMSELQRDVDSRLGSLERRLDAEMAGVRQIASSSTGTLSDLHERQREMGKRIGEVEKVADANEDRLNEHETRNEGRFNEQTARVASVEERLTVHVASVEERLSTRVEGIEPIVETVKGIKESIDAQAAQLRLIGKVLAWLGLPGAVAILTALYYLAQGGPQ